MKEMDIGFRDDEVTELFKFIDRDCGGTIDEREFIFALFPRDYEQVYSCETHCSPKLYFLTISKYLKNNRKNNRKNNQI